MNRTAALLIGSVALLSLAISTTLLGSDGRPIAVFGWIGVGLSVAALVLVAGSWVRALRRR